MQQKNCSHYSNFSRELSDIDIDHRVVYCEDEPELVRALGIRHSPNLVVNGEIIYRKHPSERELRDFLIAETSNPCGGWLL